MTFKKLTEQLNKHLLMMSKGYKLDYRNENNRDKVYIVLSNSNGIESYIINLSDIEIDFIVEYYKNYNFEISFNNMRSIFWRKNQPLF